MKQMKKKQMFFYLKNGLCRNIKRNICIINWYIKIMSVLIFRGVYGNDGPPIPEQRSASSLRSLIQEVVRNQFLKDMQCNQAVTGCPWTAYVAFLFLEQHRGQEEA